MLDSTASPPGPFSPSVLLRFLAIFLPASLLPGCVVLALYYHDRSNEETLYEQASTYLVDLHADIITRELKSVESDLLYLVNQAILRDYLSRVGAGKQELQDEYVLFCRQKALYDQIRYLDASGHEKIRINDNNGHPAVVAEAELQSKASRYYFAQTMLLDRGEVFVSPFDLNVEHDEIERPLKPVIRFATPVFDKGGAKRGVLVLNYLGAVLIRKLAEVSVNFPGRALLLNPAGYYLRGPRPEDEWGFMLGKDHSFASDYTEEWQALAGSEHGRLHTRHGLFAFRKLTPRVPVPAQPRAPTALPPANYPDPDAGDAGLEVVAQISPDVLLGRANQLHQRVLLLYAVAVLLVLVLAWYLAYAGALRRNHERRLAESEARLRILSTRLITAQEDERRSLSRDLHDELGQVVTAVTLDLQRARQARDPVKKDDLIGHGLHGATCLLDRLHEITARIRPPILDDLGLKDAVQSLLSDYQHRTGIVPQADLRFDHHGLPAVVSENVYRILQEALNNVAKHARTSEVIVVLRVDAGRVALTVRDAGVGFPPEALDGPRLGILGMRERAELLDGSFAVESQPGKGTEIHVTLPITPA
jgi:signal transduction histidine kinase